jgi:hypothetical protein
LVGHIIRNPALNCEVIQLDGAIRTAPRQVAFPADKLFVALQEWPRRGSAFLPKVHLHFFHRLKRNVTKVHSPPL